MLHPPTCPHGPVAPPFIQGKPCEGHAEQPTQTSPRAVGPVHKEASDDMPPEEAVTEVLGVVMRKAGLQPAEYGLAVVLAEEFHALPGLARALKKSPSGFCGKRVGLHGRSGTPAGMANLPAIFITRIP